MADVVINFPEFATVSSLYADFRQPKTGQMQYASLASESQVLNSTAICPVSFVWLDGFDFSYGATASFVVDSITATYNIGCGYSVDSAVSMYTSEGDETMIAWDAFYEFIMPSVQGCPVAMVQQAVRSATIEFCEKSLLWKQDSIKNDVIAGKAFYTYAPPPQAKVVGAYRVSINDQELEPWDLAKLEDFDKNWKLRKEDYPRRYVQVTDDTIRLVGIPQKDIVVSDSTSVVIDEEGNETETTVKATHSGLMADVILKPTRTANKCPTFLFTDWVESIAAGALARLHAQIGKVWAKTELVARYEKIFKEGISRAKSKADKSWQRESNEMRPVRYYGGRAYYN